MEKPAETEDQPEDIQERRKEGGESGSYHMFKQGLPGNAPLVQPPWGKPMEAGSVACRRGS